MALFDRILSGIPETDTALDNIKFGNNVLWRVSKLSEFSIDLLKCRPLQIQKSL